VLAIKDNAKQYALEYTTDDGKIDVSNLMLRSNEDIVKNIISPISTRFIGYGIDTTEIAQNMSFRVMKATDINFDNTFYTDNNLTEKDFIKAPLARPGISNTSGDIINGFTISAKAADAFENEIATQNSKQLQAVYIDFLPDNMQILVGGQPMPIKTYYKQLFGIGSF